MYINMFCCVVFFFIKKKKQDYHSYVQKKIEKRARLIRFQISNFKIEKNPAPH